MKKLMVLAGCIALTTAAATAADLAENWSKHCVSCHGKDGKGQTKAGKMADTKDLTDATYQASFTDDQAIKQVKEGLKDKAGKDRMKPFRDKLSDEEIKALVTFMRTFKK